MPRTLLAVALLLSALHASAAVTGRVVDENGKPIRGARVRARALELPEEFHARLLSKEPEPPLLATVETGEDGAFRVDVKGHAVVDLIIDAPGRQFETAEAVDREDAGTYILPPAKSRGGRVTAGGRGIAGVLVVLGRSHVTRTDAEGNYQAPDPADGNDRLAIIHPEYAIVERPIRARPDAPMIFDAALEPGKPLRGRVVDAAGRPVSGATVRASGWPLAKSGEDGSFEIARAPIDARGLYAREGRRVGSLNLDRAKPPYAIRVEQGGAIAGSVKSNKDEAPVAGARVSVSRDGATWFPRAITDAKGNFTFDAIEPGEQRVLVSHPAFQSQGIPSLRIDAAARTTRTIYATPLARLTGKVTDEENHPISGAQIRVSNAGGMTTTAPDGTFTLRSAFLESPRTLWIAKPSFAVANYGPLAVPAGETKSGLHIRLSRGIAFVIALVDRSGAPIAGEPVVLRRKVDPDAQRFRSPVPCGTMESVQCLTDENGKLTMNIVEGPYDVAAGGTTTVLRELMDQTLTARVSPMTVELDRGALIEGRIVWSDGTPADIRGTVQTTSMPPASAQVNGGSFALRNVPAGKVSLIVEAGSPSFVRGEPVEITAPASGITLKLPLLGRVEGRILDRETEQPVSEFSIVLTRNGRGRGSIRPAQSIRDEEGHFVIDDVAPGEYTVRVAAPGYASSETTNVTVEDGKTASTSVALVRGGTIAGRVTSGGRPVADARLMITVTRGGRAASERSDANGEFLFDGVAAGTQRIEIRREGYATASTSVNVVAGRETRADIDLTPGREARGRVVDMAGRPVVLASVGVRSVRGIGGGQSDVPTDSNGAFRITGLGDEPYRLTARKDGYLEASVEVNPAASVEITITLDRGGTVTGRVLGVSPAELPYIDITATGPKPVRSRTQPDAGGAFTLTGVPEGEITVFATRTRPRRDTARATVTVTNGVAPPVEIDFSAGIIVRGRVTVRGRPFNEGSLTFVQIGIQRPLPVYAEIGPDSRYELRLAEPGEYEVSVYRQQSGSHSGGRVNVGGEMTHDIDLSGTSISGRIVDAMTREPLAGAIVSMERGGDMTDGFGKFSLDLVADGSYTLRVQADGYAPESRALVVQGSTAQEVEIAMSRGVAAQIRIDDVAGQPVRATFFVMDPATKRPVLQNEFIPGVDGTMRIALHPGTFELSVFGPDLMMKRVSFTVPGPLLQVTVERRK